MYDILHRRGSHRTLAVLWEGQDTSAGQTSVAGPALPASLSGSVVLVNRNSQTVSCLGKEPCPFHDDLLTAGGREGGKEGGRTGGREGWGWRVGGMEGGREGRRERGMGGGREGKREGGMEGGREGGRKV